MKQNDFDIIVAGGGPAGIMAALHASKGGKRTALFDRKKKIGYPVRCGEAIGLKGFEVTSSVRPQWIRNRVSTLKLVAPSGKSVSLQRGFDGYVVDRVKMETDMTQDAINAGTTFFPDTEVIRAVQNSDGLYSCTTTKGDFTCRCLICADGVESKIARQFGWQTNLSLKDIHTAATAIVSDINIPTDTCSLFLGKECAPGGYVWIFPRSNTCANIGLGISGKYSTAGKPLDLLHKFIAHRFPNASISDIHAGGVPMGRWVRPLVKKGVMIVGDAARQMNCTNGAGINYSLFSGQTAGTIAAQSISNGKCNFKHLTKYEKEWAREFGKQQDRSYVLKEAMIDFTDDFINSMADSVLSEKKSKLSTLSIFLKSFSSHPILMYKAYKLFKS